uniref:Uncharacterized protein n=1 Tax=Pyrodinium bahamense TaxID=73915 RepID=A0A7S0B8G5_9DINO
MEVSFDTCGSQLNASLSIYRYVGTGAHRRLQLRSGLGGCGDRASLSMQMPHEVEQDEYKLVVEGLGSAEGDFSLRMACQLPEIHCGDAVAGRIQRTTPSRYGNSSGERLYTFSVGNGENITFDTCDSDFDTDIHIFELDRMSTSLFYTDGGCATGSSRARYTLPPLPASTRYTLLIEGYNEFFTGNFVLKMSCGS